MKILMTCILFTLLIFHSCSSHRDNKIEKNKLEIAETEKAFAKMAKEEGVEKAFLTFADDSAVIKRGIELIKGKKEIQEYFDRSTLRDIQLEWSPDFVDVSSTGDLGYTYGKFTFSALDSTGKEIESEGIFHTVWKRQKDGSWKYVWD